MAKKTPTTPTATKQTPAPESNTIIPEHTTLKPTRRKYEYEPSLDYDALKKLEGKLEENFTSLVKKVIKIDGKPYDKWTYTDKEGKTQIQKITTGRKTEFLHMINKYAVLEKVGNKYHIMSVVDKETDDEIKNIVKKVKTKRIVDKIS
jgi:hypothetical protein